MNKGGLALALCLTTTWVATASAQRGRVVPPKVDYLPDIELPDGHQFGDLREIKVPVVIDANGVGTIKTCKLAKELCGLVALAVSSAEFKPATRNGKAISSQVDVVIKVKDAELGPVPLREPPAGEPKPEAEFPGEEVVDSDMVFSAFAEIETRTHTPIELEVESLRNIPGALGEPFRALEILPGVTPLVNGQPYVYVRGAPPAGTQYVYDGITIPALFHALIGPSVLHSTLIGDLKTFNGAPAARYGRLTGGVYIGEGPANLPLDRVHGGVTARLIDSSAYLTIPVGKKDGSIISAGMIGYANALLNLANVDASLKYWNYQHREDIPFGKSGRFQLVAFGAKDRSALDENTRGEELFLGVHFHRVELRTLFDVGRWQLGTALMYGYDESNVEDRSTSVPNLNGRLHRFGPRLWATYAHKNVRVRLGGDFARVFGQPNCVQEFLTTVPTPCDDQFAVIDRRSIGGMYFETEFEPAQWVSLGLGIRSDVWSTGGNFDVGIDPRARVTFHLTDDIDLFAAYGLAHQAAGLSVPLPGFSDIPLEPGLQDSHQIEGGMRFRLPYEVIIEARAFVNIYRNLRFFDLFTDRTVCSGPGCGDIAEIDDAADGRSVGAEFWTGRNFGLGFAGFFSYTLAFTDLETTATFGSSGLGLQTFDFTPTYDVRHVLNAVASWQAEFGLIVGMRLSARSGRAEGWAYYDPAAGRVLQYIQRLPWFYRLDASIAYENKPRWGRIRVALEWINITRRAEAEELRSQEEFTGLLDQCAVRGTAPAMPCEVDYSPAIWIPNLTLAVDF